VESDSLESFFKSVVPIKELVSETNVRVRGGNCVTRYNFGIWVRFPEKDDRLTWEWSVVKSEDGWVVDFKLKTLEIQLKHHRMLEQGFQGPGDHVSRAEKMRKGLEIRLVPLAEEFVIGKPMLFRIEMTNVSGETLGFMQDSWAVNDPMIVKGPDGNKVAYIASHCQTFAWFDFIEPSETIVLVESYDVASQYHIAKPGRYSFQFKRLSVKRSNVAEVEVRSGEPSPRELLTEKLKPIVAKKWEFSRTITPCERFAAGNVGNCLALSMVDRKGGKELNASIFIRVFLDCDKSQIDYRSSLGEFWGDCRWGPVYVKSYNASIRWPGYKSQVMKALDIKQADVADNSRS